MSREKVNIVSENDTVIGEKWRDELTDNDCWRIISVWVVNSNGKILLQQRSKNKKVSPGIWTAAAEGTVPLGEDYTTCAIREVQEELGEKANLTPVGHYRGRWGGFGLRHCQGFTTTINKVIDEFNYQAEEVEQIRWFTLDEIEQLHKEQPDMFPLYDIYKTLKFIN